MRFYFVVFFLTAILFKIQAQTKQVNCIVFYTPQIHSTNTGNIFLDGLIKSSLVKNDTCLIQYSSHRLNKIKAIILLTDSSTVHAIDSINSDVVSDSKKTKYKRLHITGELNYSGKNKMFIINANDKKKCRKIKTYTVSHIKIDAACYKLICGNCSGRIF